MEREGGFLLPDEFLDSDHTLAPGQASVEYSWRMGLDSEMAALGIEHVDIYGVFPHMHELGQRYRLELLDAAGNAQYGAEVKPWDFDWQLLYFCVRGRSKEFTISPLCVISQDSLRSS